MHNSYWYTGVKRHGEVLSARTVLLSTGMESSLSLLVNTRTFCIEEAVWETNRSRQEPAIRELKELTGLKAYFGSGNELKNALVEAGRGEALPLALDAVRGLIMSEDFVLEERGFRDLDHHDEYWTRIAQNTCRYYSNPDRVTVPWPRYLDGHQRWLDLFNRFKHVAVFLTSDEEYSALASLSDSFHEMSISVTGSRREETITGASCRVERAPDPLCKETADLAKNLVGRKPATTGLKETAQLLAGSQGCTHTINLCQDLMQVLAENRSLLAIKK